MYGMMGTKDEDARRCFHNTKVTLRLAPMAGDDKNNMHEKVSLLRRYQMKSSFVHIVLVGSSDSVSHLSGAFASISNRTVGR